MIGMLVDIWKLLFEAPAPPLAGVRLLETDKAFIRCAVRPAPSSKMADCGPAFPKWDQHPLTSEAVAEAAPIAVVGKREGPGWKVVLLGSAPMEPAAARALAGDLIQMADIIEGSRW